MATPPGYHDTLTKVNLLSRGALKPTPLHPSTALTHPTHKNAPEGKCGRMAIGFVSSHKPASHWHKFCDDQASKLGMSRREYEKHRWQRRKAREAKRAQQ
jgi:hypothetical protein